VLEAILSVKQELHHLSMEACHHQSEERQGGAQCGSAAPRPPPSRGRLWAGPRSHPSGALLHLSWVGRRLCHSFVQFSIGKHLLVNFSMHFMFVTCKTCLYQNLWKVWVKIPNSKFWCAHLFILFKHWRQKCELSTANKLPHTYSIARPRAKFRDKSNHEHNILRYMAYIKVIPTHSLHKWDMWHWLICFLGLLKNGTVLETKLSFQFHILATWIFFESFLKQKHSSRYTPQMTL